MTNDKQTLTTDTGHTLKPPPIYTEEKRAIPINQSITSFPQQLYIAPLWYDLQFSSIENGASADQSVPHGVIKIEQSMTKAFKCVIILNCAIDIILGMRGKSVEDKNLISVLAYGLYGVIKNNGFLIDYIIKHETPLPKEIDVSPFIYQVEYKSGLRTDDGAMLHGNISYDNKRISVQSGIDKEHERLTVLHEIIHAILFDAAINEHPEDIIEAVHNGLYVFIMQNRQFIDLIRFPS